MQTIIAHRACQTSEIEKQYGVFWFFNIAALNSQGIILPPDLQIDSATAIISLIGILSIKLSLFLYNFFITIVLIST